MASFEFYELPSALKQVIFEFNKPKYIYENFVKSFNKKVEEAVSVRGGMPEEYEFAPYSIWISVFLDKDHYEVMEGELEDILWERGAIQFRIGDEVRANSHTLDMLPYDPSRQFRLN